MAKTRVLIVDDSFFMRKLLVELFAEDGEIEVISEAKNGQEAVALAKSLKPDVITMDYNMPEMNGAEATAEILKGEEPLPAIIMLSAATSKEAEETFISLRAGAVDFVTKPSGELSLDIEKVKKELLSKVKSLHQVKIKRPSRTSGKKKLKKAELRPDKPARLVVIGSSTGGPPAVEDILTALPADLKAAVLVVQHMPEHFTRSFADRLNKSTAFVTKEAKEGDAIRSGLCLVAPGNYHLEIWKKGDENTVHLNQDPPEHGLRPAIDVTMRSVAENFGSGVVGVILTGMGSDGTDGMRALKEAGAHTIAQSLDTAVIDSMPASVIEAGLADEVVPLNRIANRLVELSNQ